MKNQLNIQVQVLRWTNNLIQDEEIGRGLLDDGSIILSRATHHDAAESAA